MELIHHRFDEIRSTNDWGKEHIASFKQTALTIVVAEKQQQPRGQYGRTWHSPGDQNLTVSFCFFIKPDQHDALSLTHLLAISTSKLLDSEGISGLIKWPNDLLVQGRKIAGILCEVVNVEEQLGVILGLGLNVNMPASELSRIGSPATSMALEKGNSYDKEHLLHHLESSFCQALQQFLKHGFAPFLPLFRQMVWEG